MEISGMRACDGCRGYYAHGPHEISRTTAEFDYCECCGRYARTTVVPFPATEYERVEDILPADSSLSANGGSYGYTIYRRTA